MSPSSRASKSPAERRTPGAKATSKAARGEGSSRLGADDWVRAAFELMIEEGIAGVKIHRLCERLGVTKGSFYWHFDDIDTFHGELARQWAEDAARRSSEIRFSSDAESLMLDAMDVFADGRNRSLIRAMRDWAQNDDRARTSIRRADQALFQRVKEAIASLGFDEGDAEVRAKILYYAGVGFAHVGSLGAKPSAKEQLVTTWHIITRPDLS